MMGGMGSDGRNGNDDDAESLLNVWWERRKTVTLWRRRYWKTGKMVKYKGEKNTKKSNKKKDTKEAVMGD